MKQTVRQFAFLLVIVGSFIPLQAWETDQVAQVTPKKKKPLPKGRAGTSAKKATGRNAKNVRGKRPAPVTRKGKLPVRTAPQTFPARVGPQTVPPRTTPPPRPTAAPRQNVNRVQDPEAQKVFEAIRRAYRSKNYKEAVELCEQGLRQVRNQDNANRIRIVKGLALYHLRLTTAALQNFLRVARNDPNPKALRNAMDYAAASAEYIHAEEELIPVFAEHPPQAFSGDAKFTLQYEIGKAFVRQHNPVKGIEYLKRVPQQSTRYLDARLMEGIAWNELKDRAQAYRAFGDVLEAGKRNQEDQVIWELANMNAARVAFAQKDFKRAVDHYRRVPRSSTFWLDSRFEMSWPLFHTDDYNMALANLKTLHSPYFVVKFYPESLILRAIIMFRLCKYTEMKKAVQFYHREYSPYINLLTSYLREKKDSPHAYFDDVLAYVSEDKGDPGEVPGRVWDWIITDVSFGELNNRLKTLTEEDARLNRISFNINTLNQEARHTLDTQINRVRGQINRLVANRLATALNHLRTLEDQLNVLELEQTLGEKMAIERLQSPHVETDVSVSISAEEGFELWPFNGEYWKDELGFYAYSTGDSCGRD